MLTGSAPSARHASAIWTVCGILRAMAFVPSGMYARMADAMQRPTGPGVSDSRCGCAAHIQAAPLSFGPSRRRSPLEAVMHGRRSGASSQVSRRRLRPTWWKGAVGDGRAPAFQAVGPSQARRARVDYAPGSTAQRSASGLYATALLVDGFICLPCLVAK